MPFVRKLKRTREQNTGRVRNGIQQDLNQEGGDGLKMAAMFQTGAGQKAT